MKRIPFVFCLSIFLIAGCSPNGKERTATSNQPDQTEAGEPLQQVDILPLAEEDKDRTEWENPDLVLSTIGDLEGKTVADIGAGSGYFAFKMARSAKKVIALEIDQKALDYIDGQIGIVGEWAKNIETRLTPADAPNLEDEEADAVLIVNTYFYIPDRSNYLQMLFQSIKENGKLVVVDYKIGDTPVGPSDDFKVKPEDMENELREAGFKSVYVDLQSLPYQYVISAEKH